MTTLIFEEFDTFIMTKKEYQSHIKDNVGICRKCGVPCDGCEPDVMNRECPDCGAKELYGVEALLVRNEIEFVEFECES